MENLFTVSLEENAKEMGHPIRKMSGTGQIVMLLVSKGVITLDEAKEFGEVCGWGV